MAGLTAHNTLASFPAPVRRLGLPLVERLFPSTYRSLWDQVVRSFRDPRLRAVVGSTCRVRVLSGEGDTDTRGMFSAEEVEAGWRLACQTLPTGHLTIAR